jgi:hypothetical protein
MTPPSWLELLVRMTAGELEERPFVGVLEVIEMRHDDDDEVHVASEDELEWPSRVRVFKDRDRYRVEALDGTVLTIRDAMHVYVFHPPGHEPDDHEPGVPMKTAREDGIHRGAHGADIARRSPRDWRGDDFTTPTGPARAVTYLGRPAWEVELAPPPHKPSPLVLVVDAVTGMTYEQRSIEFGVLSRWTELVTVESHPEELFTWEGEAYEYWATSGPMTEEDEREWERQRAERVAAMGLEPLDLTVKVTTHPYEVEDDGSFFVSLEARVDGVLLRRPTSPEPWDPDIHYPFVERWSDDRWDWYVASGSSVEHVTQIRRQLTEPRQDER